MSGGATNSSGQMRTRQFLTSGGTSSNMAMNPSAQKKVYKFSLNHSKTNVNTSANTSQQRIMNTSGTNYNTQSDQRNQPLPKVSSTSGGSKLLLNRQSTSPPQGQTSASPNSQQKNTGGQETQQILQNNLMYHLKPKAQSPNNMVSNGYNQNNYQTSQGTTTAHKKQLFSQRDTKPGMSGQAGYTSSQSKMMATAKVNTGIRSAMSSQNAPSTFKKARNSAQATIQGIPSTVKKNQSPMAQFTGVGTENNKLSQKLGPSSSNQRMQQKRFSGQAEQVSGLSSSKQHYAVSGK